MRGFTEVNAHDVRITARGAVREAAERVFGRLWIDELAVRLASEDRTLWRAGPPGSDPAAEPGEPREPGEPDDPAGQAGPPGAPGGSGEPGEGGEHGALGGLGRVCWPAQPGPARAMLSEIGALTERARAAGLTEIVLLGSGAPARAAEMMVRHGPAGPGGRSPGRARVPLTVLDGTDPGPLLRLGQGDERLLRTLVVVTSDEAGPEALRHALTRMMRANGMPDADIAQRFVIVAEEGGPLAEFGRKDGHTVVGDGGAAAGGHVFGALSPAALVPAALAGADVAAILDDAAAVLPGLTRPENNPGLVLGAVLGGCARAGRDKLVIGDFASRTAGLADWIATLLTGATQGRLLTVVQHGGLPLTPADDLFQVVVDGRPHQDDATMSAPSLGAQLVVWEYAAAVAAHLLGADPFRGTAGDATARPPAAVAATVPARIVGPPADTVEVHVDDDGAVPDVMELSDVVRALIRTTPPDGHIKIIAYLDPDGAQGQGATVHRLAALLAMRSGRPVTVDWCPVWPVFMSDVIEKGVFLILTGNVKHDAAVPDNHRLSELELAEALDRVRILRERGRPVARLHLRDRWAGTAHLLEAARGGA